ncbi:MAG: hypothetical protein HY701_10105 [Gemmatimonadetes bacterium]|nr:hypothetical protein [Gemmatimonadota bacterium]
MIDDTQLPFFKPAEDDGPEVDDPAAIVDLFESDGLLREQVTDGHAFVSPADPAVVAAEADFVVRRVHERRQASGKRARRR